MYFAKFARHNPSPSSRSLPSITTTPFSHSAAPADHHPRVSVSLSLCLGRRLPLANLMLSSLLLVFLLSVCPTNCVVRRPFPPVPFGQAQGEGQDGLVHGQQSLWLLGGPTQLAADQPRQRRARPVTSSASAEMPWRTRYYVSRWPGRSNRRRYVPVTSVSREEEEENSSGGGSKEYATQRRSEPVRLCGPRLTNRTRQLCGDCTPPNMKKLILVDKKADEPGMTNRERLTQMCCVKRCTDDQIRNFCCGGETWLD